MVYILVQKNAIEFLMIWYIITNWTIPKVKNAFIKICIVTLKIKRKNKFIYQIKDFWLEIWYNEYVYNI